MLSLKIFRIIIKIAYFYLMFLISASFSLSVGYSGEASPYSFIPLRIVPYQVLLFHVPQRAFISNFQTLSLQFAPNGLLRFYHRRKFIPVTLFGLTWFKSLQQWIPLSRLTKRHVALAPLRGSLKTGTERTVKNECGLNPREEANSVPQGLPVFQGKIRSTNYIFYVILAYTLAEENGR